MESWRLYWHVTETRGRCEVVGVGVARPGQEIPTGAMEMRCSGGKEESIWLYRAVRTRLTGRHLTSVEETSRAIRSLLGELQPSGQ